MHTYNVPLTLLDAYPGRSLIARSADPAAIAQDLLANRLVDVAFVQLLNPSADFAVLGSWGHGLPIELVLDEPRSEAGKLYRFAKLLRAHPLRVVIPVKAGFSKAVKVASALQLPVKIEGTQPDPLVIEELGSVLEFFLHQKTVSQPIEFFTGLLMALLHKSQDTLWDIQEEDPAMVRFITDDDREVVARRPFAPTDIDLDLFSTEFTERVLSPGAECASCEFFPHCGGYFKWPNPKFSCEGIKTVLRKLRDEAYELHDDLSAFSTTSTEQER